MSTFPTTEQVEQVTAYLLDVAGADGIVTLAEQPAPGVYFLHATTGAVDTVEASAELIAGAFDRDVSAVRRRGQRVEVVFATAAGIAR